MVSEFEKGQHKKIGTRGKDNAKQMAGAKETKESRLTLVVIGVLITASDVKFCMQNGEKKHYQKLNYTTNKLCPEPHKFIYILELVLSPTR